MLDAYGKSISCWKDSWIFAFFVSAFPEVCRDSLGNDCFQEPLKYENAEIPHRFQEELST